MSYYKTGFFLLNFQQAANILTRMISQRSKENSCSVFLPDPWVYLVSIQWSLCS